MSNRMLKINSEIQRALGDIINYKLDNPGVSGLISVIKVETTADLDICKVYLSIYNANKEEVMNNIKHSASFIRKELCNKIALRKMPHLNFYLDETSEYGAKIDSLINKIQKK